MKKSKKENNELTILESLVGKKQSDVQKLLGIPKQKDKAGLVSKWFYPSKNKELIIEIKSSIVIGCSSFTRYKSFSLQQLNSGLIKRYLTLNKYKMSAGEGGSVIFILKNRYVLLILNRIDKDYLVFYKFFKR